MELQLINRLKKKCNYNCQCSKDFDILIKNDNLSQEHFNISLEHLKYDNPYINLYTV